GDGGDLLPLLPGPGGGAAAGQGPGGRGGRGAAAQALGRPVMKRGRWSGSVLLVVFLLPAGARDQADEREAAALAQRYFDTYARKDLEGVLALWSAKAPEAAAWRGRLRTLFAETGPIALKALEVVKVEVGK